MSNLKKIKDESTITLSATQSALVATMKGAYGNRYMGHIPSAIEVLKHGTAYPHHNVFTLYEALLDLTFLTMDSYRLKYMMKQWFRNGRRNVGISVDDIVASMLSEITNLQVNDLKEDHIKVLIDYNNKKIPELATQLKEAYEREMEKAVHYVKAQ